MNAFIRLSAALTAVALSAPAFAGGYPTCAQAQAAVVRKGAAVVYTAPHTYDRYVANRSHCEVTQTTRPAFVATVDNPACLVGSVCIEKEGRRRLW
ncbi:MAG: hypothetical protein IPL88_02885 [Rhizobiales bacterium]|nr:hypothetical protein [Hyphomicrobiales bacterium]